MPKEPKDRRTMAKARAKAAPKTSEPAPIKKNPPNRPTIYTDEICLEVEKMAAKGATDEEIATAIGIGRRTFYEWKQRHAHFSHAINKYRGLANMMVENALFNTAIGYEFTEQQGTASGHVVDVKKYAHPSVNAQKFYLTNRMPDRYKNKVETTMQLGQTVDQMVVAIKRRE